MKKNALLTLLFLGGTTFLFSQTKKIAHRSHSGSDATFSTTASIHNFGEIYIPTPEEKAAWEKERARQDSLLNEQRKKMALEIERQEALEREEKRIQQDPLYHQILKPKKQQQPAPPKIKTPQQCTPTSQDTVTQAPAPDLSILKSEIPVSSSTGSLPWLVLLLSAPALLVLWKKLKR